MNVSDPACCSTESFSISVIVPTYNRLDSLKVCLEHLEQQTAQDFEVIVVSDGSTDATDEWMTAYQATGRLRLLYLRQENAGPARARNKAIALSRSPVCLMIGDDILASKSLLQTHLDLHERRPELSVAGLGLTAWCDIRQHVTPFMRWLDESGLQFDYAQLQNGVAPDWRHFYTSNLSVKTELLRRFAFNEAFKKAATEDLELGYRIEREIGLELVYLAQATAKHLHPTSFLQSCQRMQNVGEAMNILHTLRPELKGPSPGSLKGAIRKLVFRAEWLLSPVTRWGDLLTRIWCPNPVMRLALRLHYAFGYWRERRS